MKARVEAELRAGPEEMKARGEGSGGQRRRPAAAAAAAGEGRRRRESRRPPPRLWACGRRRAADRARAAPGPRRQDPEQEAAPSVGDGLAKIVEKAAEKLPSPFWAFGGARPGPPTP